MSPHGTESNSPGTPGDDLEAGAGGVSALHNLERLRALEDTALVEEPPEEVFERLTAMATRLTGVPVALVSLVGRDRQFFASQRGLGGWAAEERGTPLSHSFCRHVVQDDRPLVVTDAREHPDLKDSPAIPELGVVAYAGMPLRTRSGHVLGSFCAIGHDPVAWSPQDLAVLEELAGWAVRELELRIDLSRSREEADDASRKTEAKTTFLSTMSHELRTPLNAIIGFSGLLLKKKADDLDEQATAWVERIRENGGILLGLVNDILDLSKVEAGRLEIVVEPVDLGDVVRDVAEQLETMVAPGVLLAVRVPDRIEEVELDPGRCRQIVTNLAANALRFTREGSVTLEVECRDGRPTAIHVRDTGPGIPADRLDAIFEAFGQAAAETARDHGGTGLGLTISRALAERMGGRLTVRSTSGEGSTFTFEIP